MKNKKILISLISILSIIYLGLFYYYIQYYNNDKPVELKINTPNSNMTVDKALKFIKDYKIDYLDNINNSFTLKDITNQNKLRYVYYAIKDDVDFNSGVSYTKFITYLKNVFESKVTLKNENIVNLKKEPLLIYDENNEVYKYNGENTTYDFLYSSYNNVVDFQEKKDEYILTVNKFFVVDNNVFSSIDEAKKQEKVLFSIDNETVSKESYIKDYLKTNYNILKDKLYTYKYYFIKENGNLILVKYEKIIKH